MYIRQRRLRWRLFGTLVAAVFASSLLATAARAASDPATYPITSYYPITNAAHLCMEEGAGGYITEKACNYSVDHAQLWMAYFVMDRAGYYSYLNYHTGHCLGVEGGSAASGANLRAGTCGGFGNHSQFWSGLRISGPRYQPMRNYHSGLYVTPYGYSRSSGTTLEQVAYVGNATQQWNRPD